MSPSPPVFLADGLSYPSSGGETALQTSAIALQSLPENRLAAKNGPDAATAPAMARVLRPQNGGWQWLMPHLASITPQYLEMTLRRAAAGSHTEQAALFRLMLDTWPELSACVQELAYAVARLKLIVEPFAEEDEQPTDDAIARQKLVSAALRSMRPDAAADENDLGGTIRDLVTGWICGTSILEIDWHLARTPSAGTFRSPRATWWAEPTAWGMGSDGRLGLAERAGRTPIVPFPEHKFLIGIHKAQSGTPFASALLRPLAWWWCAANFSADWLLNLAQIFGLPFRWANYDPTAPQETVDRICAMLQNMGSAGWAAFPSGTTLELKDAAKSGDHSPQGELLDRADRYARLLILGQTLSGAQDSSRGGGKAFGSVEADVKAQRVDACGRFVCGVLNTQLVPSILALNFGDAEEAPAVRLLEDEEGGLAEAQRDEILSRLMPLSQSFLRKKYGQPAPRDEGDEAGGVAGEERPTSNLQRPTSKPEGEQPGSDDFGGDESLQSAEGAGHPFRGNQYTGGRGSGVHKPPRRMSDADADKLLVKGFNVQDADGVKVHFGTRLKDKLEGSADYAGRKELLRWGRETVRSGKKTRAHENNEDRDYYGKFFNDAGDEKGMMVIVSVHDGEAFNIFRAPRKYLRKKGLSAKDAGEGDEPGEQPPVAVLRALAAAGGAPDWWDDNLDGEPVKNRLAEIVAIEDDALFAKALEDFAETL